MSAPPVHRRTATSSSVDHASNIVKGKALHYQSESALSYSDSGFSKGNRLSVHEENAEKQLLNQRKNDKVAEKSSKDFNSQDKRPINGPTVDGLVFTRVNSTIQYGKLVIHRTPDERFRNPERLNLDRRDLDACPLLQHEDKLRLLNYQNNNITAIANLENLPHLIFLDFYNNNLRSLDGPLSWVPGLRVLMAGKNQINAISNLSHLKKLDVLDLHSNEISEIQGLDSLTELRVLNLAGNQIALMQNLTCLRSLTELNIRRNCLESVRELDALPALQRVFLSHNFIAKSRVIDSMPKLQHLDLKPVTPEERALSSALFRSPTMDEVLAEGPSAVSRPPKPQTSQKGKGLSIPPLLKKRSSLSERSRSPDMMNLFVDSTKSSKSALSERESRTVDDVMIPGKEWQRTSDTSFPSSSLFLSNGSEKAGTRTRKMAEGKRTILAENEDWRWPWRESAESGGDWQETTAWLAGVTEVCVRHMSVPRALSEVSMHAHCLPSVSAIQLVDNDITTLHQNSLRAYIACTMPRLKFFNDISITEQERAPSPAGAPAPIPSAATESGRDRLETSALDDPQERSRDRERERKRDRDKEAETETFLGPRSGSAMCYPLRARDLDREEEDALPHSTASSTSPRPSSPPSHRQSYLNAGADAESLSQAASSSSIGTDADHSNPEEAERIFKAMVLTYFRQVIHETVESLCPI